MFMRCVRDRWEVLAVHVTAGSYNDPSKLMYWGIHITGQSRPGQFRHDWGIYITGQFRPGQFRHDWGIHITGQFRPGHFFLIGESISRANSVRANSVMIGESISRANSVRANRNPGQFRPGQFCPGQFWHPPYTSGAAR